MYVESSYFKKFPARPEINVRSRYKEYYQDLHTRYKIPLDISTLTKGSKYTFAELAKPLLDILHRKGKLNQAELMVLTYWAYEFDPDYSAVGMHLAHHYKFKGDIFDVFDQGNICSITALSIISKLGIEKGVCLSLDQTCVPRRDASRISIPTVTASSALYFSSKQPQGHSIKIIDTVILSEAMLYEKGFNILKIIFEFLEHHSIAIEDCILSCKQNSIIYRVLRYQINDHPNLIEQIEFDLQSLNLGCTEIFFVIHQLLFSKNNLLRKYHLILAEDVESIASGFVLIEKVVN